MTLKAVTNRVSILGKKPGRHSTAQRQLLLEIIRGAEGHLDADELYQQARQRRPALSLSTVYRSLRLFKELGLVEEHQFDDARRRYEVKPRIRHYHLVCLGCGRVLEFQCPSAERVKSKLSREEGFRVTDAEVCLIGYCSKCQEQLLASGADTKIKQRIAERG
ncbi:hypothetical protein ES706_04053 [subsurface metagenome]